MTNIITNKGFKNLENRISDLIKLSKEVKFLVGFFYFSGLSKLYESLKKNDKLKLKILVGLNVDKLNREIIEIGEVEEINYSDKEKIDIFLNSIKKSINSDQFDKKEFYEQVDFFIDLIKNKRLEIRKTFSPNHSKLYLFYLEDTQAKNKIFITGSSNLTNAGLNLQNEFNVEITDWGFSEAEKYFDDLWDEAIKITEDDELRQQLIDLLENKTLIRKIYPFEAYFYALHLYVNDLKNTSKTNEIIEILKENQYKIYKYQIDAINQALSILEKHNGVILADVVGLGKTIIACSIAKILKKRGIVICPPTLLGDSEKKDVGWEMYKDQFKLYDWEVWSLGKLEKLNEQIKTRLNNVEVVIIDEAHRFRNQDTKSYSLLKKICRGRKVILLTATPFNNSPADILSLLSLFITPKKSTITLNDNLADIFRIYQKEFEKLSFIKKNYNSADPQKKQEAIAKYQSLFEEDFLENEKDKHLRKINQRTRFLSQRIRGVIEKVIIRRNRLDLKENPDYEKEVNELSEVADPKEWFFELDEKQNEFYDFVLKSFADPELGGSFKGAIYQPFLYEKNQDNNKNQMEKTQQRNLYDFMRRLLVKRFESSFGAFEQSIKNFIRITKIALNFVEKTNKFILDRDLIEKIYDNTIEEIEKELKLYSEKLVKGEYPKNHKIYDFSNKDKKTKFINDIQSDLKLLENIFSKIDELKLVTFDPKVEKLIFELKNSLKNEPNRKIVIFSEYLDTVKYLAKILIKNFNSRILVIDRDLNSKLLAKIKENFDATSKKQSNDYDIILTTDRLSEGYNLNRAGMVINYDIPWNPVRVIQRLGRINRISKKVFDELYIVNFFPTVKGANYVKSKEIAANKMYLIHNTLGEDAKIFEADETPSASQLYQKLNENPEKNNEINFYTKVYKEYLKLKSLNPDLLLKIKSFPYRLKVAKKGLENELILLIKKTGNLFILHKIYNEKQKINEVSFDLIFEKIKCDKNEKTLSLSSNFWDSYYQLKNYKSSKVKINENSLENSARNNLKTILRLRNINITSLRKFLNDLIDDIENYGTLSHYDLRILSNLDLSNEEKINESINKINKLKEDLGEDYLEREKNKKNSFNKELIIAIENQK